MSFINRRKKEEIKQRLNAAAAVVLLGQRRVGKTTLAMEIAREQKSDYLNLRNPQTAAMLDLKGLAESIEESGKHLTIIDEIQVSRSLFEELLAVIDEKRWRGEGKGCFLLIGSGSYAIANKSSESLLGRVSHVDLDPIDVTEIKVADDFDKLWLRGGLPGAFAAGSDRECFEHLQSLAETLSMYDLREEGAKAIRPGEIINILKMLAAIHGGPASILDIARKLDLDRRAVSRCVNLLEGLLVIRILRPYGRSGRKSSVKRPKIYLRDSGMLHYLLGVKEISSLDPHMAEMSWKGFVIENILRQTDLRTIPNFYCTHGGANVGLILHDQTKGTWAIEIKKDEIEASSSFHRAMLDIKPDRSFLAHGRLDLPQRTDSRGVEIVPLLDMCREVASCFGS